MSGKVFWDTNLLIYRIEQVAAWSTQMEALVAWQKEEKLEAVTSTLSLAEILARPLSLGKHKLADRYRDIICEIGALPFGAEEASVAARLRAQYAELKPADAMQLACASVCGVQLFLTSDRRLKWVAADKIGAISTLADWYDSHMGAG